MVVYVPVVHTVAARRYTDWTDLDQSPEKENATFQLAVMLVGSEFTESVRFHVKSWLPVRSIVFGVLVGKRKG
ncbi:hypothetical protein GUJ93_ZPchr0008g13601 [Zizania palustris]|uniref:Uncharacterized protein n=1 Tax=Zizania palustris TaxID=103762 RepID=A0A8J5RKA5_ZIZPA|nr:hypothetical protein GUJ93_ZPchr0008g13601 [Zizania palustris]